MRSVGRATEIYATALTGALLAALYVSLYELNVLLMGDQNYSGIASLVFLPAFVRLVAVLIIGWWAIPTLFVAAWFCVDLGLNPSSQLVVSCALALGAPVAIQIARTATRLRTALSNLTGRTLLILSLASALGNAIAYHISLGIVGSNPQLDISFPTTIIGDAIGTWIAIYTIKCVLLLIGKRLPSHTLS